MPKIRVGQAPSILAAKDDSNYNEAWIGLELEALEDSEASQLLVTFLNQGIVAEIFFVTINPAIEILSKTSPEAADFFRRNISDGTYFAFPKNRCEIID